METRTLIPAHNGVHKPSKRQITFVNHKQEGIGGSPVCYSKQANRDGSVTLTEYVDPKEYANHRNQVFAEIARYHSRTGKQPGCECATCR